MVKNYAILTLGLHFSINIKTVRFFNTKIDQLVIRERKSL